MASWTKLNMKLNLLDHKVNKEGAGSRGNYSERVKIIWGLEDLKLLILLKLISYFAVAMSMNNKKNKYR
jgi:hypothetical protein